MIKKLIFENTNGEKLELELGAPEKTGLWVKSIKGIGPGKATINVTDLASSDGGIYNSSRSETRNITLTIGVMSYISEELDPVTGFKKMISVEEVRRSTYKWFAKKKKLKLTIITDVDPNLYAPILTTEGYVESNEPDIFNKNETMAISIICPDPNWYVPGYDGSSFSSIVDLFKFPMEFIQTTDTVFKNGYYPTTDSTKLSYKNYYTLKNNVYEIYIDPEFVPGVTYYEFFDKVYYEYDLAFTDYYPTTDTEPVPGKTYYEENNMWNGGGSNDGYENSVTDYEYRITEDTVLKSGKEYFELINGEYLPITDQYFITTDETMQTNKAYYELVDNQYVQTTDQSFVQGKTYYECAGLAFVIGKTYYEHNDNTKFAEVSESPEQVIDYIGEIETGLTFIIYISGEVTGLNIYKILDVTSGSYEVMSLDDKAIQLAAGGSLNAGDEIRICTIPGKKYAYLIRNAEEINIMNALGKTPAWFLLSKGTNVFAYHAESGSGYVSLNINYVNAYEGI